MEEKTKITRARVALIATRLNEDKSYRDIGTELGISKQRVGQLAKDHDLQARKKKRQVLPEHKAELRHIETMDRLLTVGKVANLLGVHVNTVRWWSNTGMLKCYRLGSRGDRRYRKADVDSFLSGRSEKHGPT